MAHPQHNFTSNFNGSDGHNAELTLNINGVEQKYTPAGNDQTYNVPGVARIDINLDGSDLVQAIQTALDGAAQPVLVERSIYDEEYVYQYIGDIDGQWYFGTCTTNKIVTITVAKEDGAVNDEQIPVANGVVIVESDSLNVYSRLRTALALGQLPVLNYVGANPVYAQYEKTADNGDLIFVGALATASDTYVQYNIYTVSDNNTVTVTTRAASAGGGGTPDDENGFFNSSLYQTPGDGVTESITLNDFRIKQGTSIHGSNIEFVPTHQEGGIDFGEVYLNPGTYILSIRYTLQWVGNPRGTFLPLVCNVGGQPFDFSYEQENTLITSQIRVVTARQKVSVAFPFDADTPPMGIWVETLSIAQLASNTHPAVIHDTTLAGSGTAGSPLGVTTDAFGKIKDIPTSISQFRTGDVIPVDGPNGPAKMPASDLQDAILGGPIDEAVQDWLDEHPEATTTVQDGSVTNQKLNESLKNEITLTCSTVSDVRHNLNIAIGRYVKTQGYYSAGDGGGAEYYVRELVNGDVDDGGGIIICDNGLVCELVLSTGRINVKCFGAKDDFSFDSRFAIINAIKFSQTKYPPETADYGRSMGGAHIYFPIGKYYVSQAITQNDVKQDVTFEGDGMYMSTIKFNDGFIQMHSDGPHPHINAFDLGFTGFGGTAGNICFSILQPVASIIERCVFHDMGFAINYYLTVGNVIKNCLFGYCDIAAVNINQNAGVGPATSTLIEGCWFYRNKTGLAVEYHNRNASVTSICQNSIFEYNQMAVKITGHSGDSWRTQWKLENIHIEGNNNASVISNCDIILNKIDCDSTDRFEITPDDDSVIRINGMRKQHVTFMNRKGNVIANYTGGEVYDTCNRHERYIGVSSILWGRSGYIKMEYRSPRLYALAFGKLIYSVSFQITNLGVPDGFQANQHGTIAAQDTEPSPQDGILDIYW